MIVVESAVILQGRVVSFSRAQTFGCGHTLAMLTRSYKTGPLLILIFIDLIVVYKILVVNKGNGIVRRNGI